MLKFGFIFPGQGTQYIGMLREHYLRSPIVKETFQQASDILNRDLWKIITGSDPLLLNKTDVTQPAILTASTALWRLWTSLGGKEPSILAGHSLGEYSALVASGVLDFDDALPLVALRGQFMTSAVPEGQGKMVAVLGLKREQVITVCDQISAQNVGLGLVAAVNFNSQAQTVIAGNKSAVSYAEKILKQNGASRILPLAVSVPSHCYLMKPAAEKLEFLLESIRFNQPVIDLVNNVDVKCERNAAEIKTALVNQLYSPVRWQEIIQHMELNHSIDCLVEVGPGKTLSGLVKRISKNICRFSTCEPKLFFDAFAHINK